ncbi:MAG: putative linear pentadecapeptide gramicidin synthetase LgrB, partial [Roseomonas sp.]|nr:putative linear pentadecapeptide gramicidin synthetase LgrB [Roseomonas sp.]
RGAPLGGPPRGPTEQALHAIWSTVLGRESIGRDEDFFAAGGHSLAALRLIAQLRSRFATDLPLSSVFSHPTIAALATQLPAVSAAVNATPIAFMAPQPDDPLTGPQQRLWLLAQGDPAANAAYALVAAFLLEGALDLPAFDAAATEVLARHDSLRSVFPAIGGVPRCLILDPGPMATGITDVSGAADPLEAALAASRAAAAEPFDLATGPLLRLHLWRLDPAGAAQPRHLLLVALHHIIGDARSMDVLMRDLGGAYARHRGGGTPPPPLPVQARDIAAHDRAALTPEAAEASLTYWRRKLAAPLPVLGLPTDRPYPARRGWQGQTLAVRLPADVAERLEAIARGLGASVFVVLLALAKVQLHRLTGQTDIVLGSVVSGRDDAVLDDQIGFHVETVALRDTIDPALPFAALVAAVRRTVDEAVAHRRYPFEKVVQALDLPRDPSRSPIFDAMLVFEDAPAPLPEAAGLRATPLPLASPVSKLDLTFHLCRDPGGIGIAIEYRTDLFDAARIARMLAQFTTLAESVAADTGAPVAALRLLPVAETTQLAAFGAGPLSPMPEGSIAEAFVHRVRTDGDRLAIVTPARSLTYAALDRLAEDVAIMLRDAGGLLPGETVLVMLDRGILLVGAMLGTLKAGGVYMPADLEQPSGRVATMLRRGRCRLAIATQAPPGMTALASCGDLHLFVAATAPAPLEEPDPAYVIFTSGSTGEPKGVVLGHRGFLSMIQAQIEAFGIVPGDRVLFFASPSFDASMSEIFMALLAGAALVPVPAATVADASAFLSDIRALGVTVATLPPAYLAALGRPELDGLRVLITAGEAPVAADLRHYARRLHYFNAYGPTETSVCASIWPVPQDGWNEADLPIGRPIGNTTLHVLDAQLDPAPIGVPGEIFIEGAGLALGYVGDAAATQRAFISWRGRRLYRSGDQGSWRADGLLLYGGRLDQQIKIRGQRVEPAEAEAAFLAQPEIAQAVVLPRGDSDGRHLVAWVVAQAGGAAPPDEAGLRARLATLLPRAMLPRHIVWLAALPRTVNGKIDRAALPDPVAIDASAMEDAPRTPDETILAAAFAQALGRPSVGIHADFFEMGGDSIRLLQVTAELSRRGLSIEIADAYRTPTVAALAAGLRQRIAGAGQGPVTGPAPLTAAQAWFFRNFGGDPNHFNQTALLRAPGGLDPAGLRAALAALVLHHDALRLRIVETAGHRSMDFAAPGEAPAVTMLDLRDDPGAEATMQDSAEALQRGLDIARGPVLAAVLFRLPDEDALLLAIHHLAVDAVSWRILIEDLSQALEAIAAGRPIAFPPKTHAFKDWAEQQARIASSPALAAEHDHWKTAGEGATALPQGAGHHRETQLAILPLTELPALREHAGTIEPALLAAFAQALAPRLGLGPLVVTLEGHGRQPIAEGLDVGRTVGWFTSLYPVRLDLAGLAPQPALAATIGSLAKVPNRGSGYGMLAELAVSGHGLRLPPGGIAFNYLGDIAAPSASGPFAAEIGSLGDPVDPEAPSLFAIDLLASRRGGSLHLALSHDPDALSPSQGQAALEAMRDWLAGLPVLPAASPTRAAFRPYLRRVADDAPLVLNADAPVAIFAMPPLFGYGAAFRGLGELLPGGAFHAFDFIEAEDREQRYAQAIAARAGGRPIVVLGYSGGGNLAYAVARAATLAGHAPAALILLDAPAKQRRIEQDNAAIDAMMSDNLGYFRDRMAGDDDYRAYVENPDLRAMMLRRMGAFIRYLNALVDEGSIAADIHLIRSEQQWATPGEWSGWADRTTGRLVVHQGSGDHAHMTDGGHTAHNAAIVAGILATLAPGDAGKPATLNSGAGWAQVEAPILLQPVI